MLDHGFLPNVKQILNSCPRERQHVLFTATASKSVQALIADMFSDSIKIESKGHHRVVPNLETINKYVVHGNRMPILQKLLNETGNGGTLIFTNTREQCDKLAAELSELGHFSVVYRGEMDKVERRNNLKNFREGKVSVLISTDLAARGLDVDHVNRVINYHLPKQIDNYLHRVGRTARAGRKGTVYNLVTERDEPLIQTLNSMKQESEKKKNKKKNRVH
jgi:superfamily II DNA/RNA helicase